MSGPTPQRAPIFFVDTPAGQFYGLPSIDGKMIKVAEHTGGEAIADPSSFDRINLQHDKASVSSFVSERLDTNYRSWRRLICHLRPSRVRYMVTDISTVGSGRLAVTVAGLAFLLFPATTRCKLLADDYDSSLCANWGTRCGPH